MRGKLNKNLKKRIIKSIIWSVVLYVWKTWKGDIKRLEAFEIWIWQGMESISWIELRTNEEIQMVKEKRFLIGIIM